MGAVITAHVLISILHRKDHTNRTGVIVQGVINIQHLKDLHTELPKDHLPIGEVVHQGPTDRQAEVLLRDLILPVPQVRIPPEVHQGEDHPPVQLKKSKPDIRGRLELPPTDIFNFNPLLF